MKRTWTIEQLKNAVAISYTKAQVLEKLGLKKGGSYRILNKYLSQYQIDISHFLKPDILALKARLSRAKRNIKEMLVENGTYSDSKHIKSYLLRESIFDYKCNICGVNEWNNKELVLQLDHVNGIYTDNRLENLRLLCPNCHSQTETFCGRKLKLNEDKLNYCLCGTIIHRTSKQCKLCKSKNQVKIDWPDVKLLKIMVGEFGYLEVGRRLGVSDNAVRKRIKKYGSVA